MKNKFQVIITETLKEKLIRSRFSEWKRLDNLKSKLEVNPFTGRRLAYNLFEKKWGPFRVYYIIIENILLVIVIDYAHKKEQKSVINYILSNWDEIISDITRKYK